MQISLKRWVQKHPSCPGVGSYQTTVTVIAPTVTFAVTLPGREPRKKVLQRVWLLCQAEGCWSPSFLRELKDAK